MSYYEDKFYKEDTPLLSKPETNRFDYNATNPRVPNPTNIENLLCTGQKNLITSYDVSDNQSLLSYNDGNNNSSDNQEDNLLGVNLQQQEIRVYAKRWYILAVFSILGVLQVRYNFTTNEISHAFVIFVCVLIYAISKNLYL